MIRRALLAAATVATVAAVAAPASAQPCIPNNPVAFVCVVPEFGSIGRYVVVGVYDQGAVPGGVVLGGAGCTYRGYYVYGYTSWTGGVQPTVPGTAGLPCV